MKRFPEGKYGKQTLRFFPAPFHAPLRSFAALVIAWQDDDVLICDIADRGWTVPSGRVEPDEDSRDAVLREAVEEGGAILSNIQYIGCYQITERREVRRPDCYAALIDRLEEIALPQESRGRKLVKIEELPCVYHIWNELTQKVFEHAYEVVSRAGLLRG